LSEVGEVLEKFDELESAMGTRFAKIDPLLIVDLILLKLEQSNIHVVIFIKQKQNTKKIRDMIIKQM
jgi:hypothetical protein